MFMADTNITLYNALYDEDAGYDNYKRTVLSGVSWFSRTQTSVSSDGGLLAANEITVRIPGEICDGYVAPKDYTGASGTWTLQPGDIIVKGAVPDENPRPAELKAKYEMMTIVGVTDNRAGKGPHLKHEFKRGSVKIFSFNLLIRPARSPISFCNTRLAFQMVANNMFAFYLIKFYNNI